MSQKVSHIIWMAPSKYYNFGIFSVIFIRNVTPLVKFVSLDMMFYHFSENKYKLTTEYEEQNL